MSSSFVLRRNQNEKLDISVCVCHVLLRSHVLGYIFGILLPSFLVCHRGTEEDISRAASSARASGFCSLSSLHRVACLASDLWSERMLSLAVLPHLFLFWPSFGCCVHSAHVVPPVDHQPFGTGIQSGKKRGKKKRHHSENECSKLYFYC